jgi:hypothetical protein
MLIPPRNSADVLTQGIGLLGRVWRTLIPPAFGAFMILGALTVILFEVTEANELMDLVFNNPEGLATLPDEQLQEIGLRFLSVGLRSAGIQLVASVFVALAAHRAAGAALAGKSVSAGEASLFAARRMLPGVLAAGIALMGVLAGLILFIIPGIWIAFSLSMVLPVIALEDARPSQALNRSFQIVRGRWWPTAGFLLVVGLLGSVAGGLLQLVALPLLTVGDLSIGAGLGFVASLVVQGFIVAAIAVMATAWYVDLRARTEALTTESFG